MQGPNIVESVIRSRRPDLTNKTNFNIDLANLTKQPLPKFEFDLAPSRDLTLL